MARHCRDGFIALHNSHAGHTSLSADEYCKHSAALDGRAVCRLLFTDVAAMLPYFYYGCHDFRRLCL